MVSLSTKSLFYHIASVWSGTSGRENEDEKTQINKQDFFCALHVIRCVLSWKSKNFATRRHDFFEVNTFWPSGFGPLLNSALAFAFFFWKLFWIKFLRMGDFGTEVICLGGVGVFRFLQFSKAFNINASCWNNWRTTQGWSNNSIVLLSVGIDIIHGYSWPCCQSHVMVQLNWCSIIENEAALSVQNRVVVGIRHKGKSKKLCTCYCWWVLVGGCEWEESLEVGVP